MECTLKTNALCLVTFRRVHSVPSGLVTFDFFFPNSLKQRKYLSPLPVLPAASPGPRVAVSRGGKPSQCCLSLQFLCLLPRCPTQAIRESNWFACKKIIN